jgi:hypothetical protein
MLAEIAEETTEYLRVPGLRAGIYALDLQNMRVKFTGIHFVGHTFTNLRMT